MSLNALLGLAFPNRFGQPPENPANQRYDSPSSILNAFGVAGTNPRPGAAITLFETRDANATSKGAAIIPAANPDQFGITLQHGVLNLAPHITRRAGFQHLVLNFRRDEEDGKWSLADIDFRKFEDQAVTTIKPHAGNIRDINLIVTSAKRLLAGAVIMPRAGEPARLDRYGDVIAQAASRQVAAIDAAKAAEAKAAKPANTTASPLSPGGARAA